MRKLMEAVNYIDEMEIDEAAGGIKVPTIIYDEDDGEVYSSDQYIKLSPKQVTYLLEVLIGAVFGGGTGEGVDTDSILVVMQELGLTVDSDEEEWD